MPLVIIPSELKGEIVAPPSKSMMQRAVAAALMAKGESVIHNAADSEDSVAAIGVAQALGAIIQRSGNVVSIRGGFPYSFISGMREPRSEIQCNESGLTSRLFSPIAALHEIEIMVNGSGTLLRRPFRQFEELFPQLGVTVKTTNGFLPLSVKGPMHGGEITLDGAMSSQFLSGLLMALPRCKQDSILHVSNLHSKPYADLTLEVMAWFGVESKHQDHSLFQMKGSQAYQARDFTVSGDWSGAAFLFVAAALCSTEGVIIKNLGRRFTQADAMILDALAKAGVEFDAHDEDVFVKKSSVRAFEFDATNCPDLFPPLAALAAFGDGVSVIRGVRRLIHKESNRGKVLKEEFGKAGIHIALRDDEMLIHPAHVRPAALNAHNDHRMAMACALLGLNGAKITLSGSECITKSYPAFWDHLRQLGARL